MYEPAGVTQASGFGRSPSDGIGFGLRFMGRDALTHYLCCTLNAEGNVSAVNEESEASDAQALHVPQVQGQAPPSSPSAPSDSSPPSVTFVHEGLLVVVALGAAYGVVEAKRTHNKTPFDVAFDREGATFKIDSDLLRAIAKVESNLNPNAVSKMNANGTHDYGLMQINDRTAEALHVNRTDLFDPDLNIHTGARLLNMLRSELGSQFTPYTWIAAYNAGAPKIKQSGIVNPAYVGHVMLEWQMYKVGRA